MAHFFGSIRWWGLFQDNLGDVLDLIAFAGCGGRVKDNHRDFWKLLETVEVEQKHPSGTVGKADWSE